MTDLECALFVKEITGATYLVDRGFTIIVGEASEPRQRWLEGVPLERKACLSPKDPTTVQWRYNGKESEMRMKSPKDIAALLDLLPSGPVVMDITSLGHEVWAPILRVALQRHSPFFVSYVEPEKYSRTQTSEIYDLSERTLGIAPLPGFASFQDKYETDSVFIPILGFEGARLAFIMERVQPHLNTTFPIVGLPGFLTEFPMEALLANRNSLLEDRLSGKIHYASANNPFSLFAQLHNIAQRFPGKFIKIAPIGTKPHALGAFLFPIKTQRRVEFIYDHPIRRSDRTSGSGRMLLYNVSSFMDYAT